jgi:hypothetical protein
VTGNRPQGATIDRLSTAPELLVAATRQVEKPQLCQRIHPGPTGPGSQSGEAMHHTSLAVVRDDTTVLRDETGATTAEYATVTGCGVGFAAVLFKFLTSDAGQQLLQLIFNAIKALLPF